MSRLDMNTCQMSIKADILFSAAVTHIPGLSRQTRDHHIGSHRTELRGLAHQTEQRISQIRIVDRLLKLP